MKHRTDCNYGFLTENLQLQISKSISNVLSIKLKQILTEIGEVNTRYSSSEKLKNQKLDLGL